MSLETLAAVLFALSICHTFSVKFLHHLAKRFPEESVWDNLLHLLGEVEVVFPFWAGVFILIATLTQGGEAARSYVNGLNFTEPLFVFVIMAMAATRPILTAGEFLISGVARLIPLPRDISFYFSALTVGPILGSFITEPAAMTVTALLLKRYFFDTPLPTRVKYATLAVLFVNISIGGVLTSFAAPPVLMVASTWGWDSPFMASHFGWKAVCAVLVNAILASLYYARNRIGAAELSLPASGQRMPISLVLVHLLFLFLVVANAHYAIIFVGLFIGFLGVATVSRSYQDPLKLKESLLVAGFLGGLVVLGGLQAFWVSPLVMSLPSGGLFWGATGLTALLDNAALTYLGSQIPGITDDLKYSLVAGAVTGGGLTVIANAPNPAGFSILKESFGDEGISPLGLLVFALIPTFIAALAFLLL